jgi:pimeloyl-ACP methyl ester carboxylesterase
MARLVLEQTELSYEVAGQGPRVLMIQGAGCAGSAWGSQIEALRERYTLAWFDNRGVGQSAPLRSPLTIAQMAGDARALLDALGWERAHLVGHSMGGLIATQLALDAPERVESLALLCTFHRGADAAALSWDKVWLGLRSRVGSAAMRRRAFLEMIVPGALLAGMDVAATAQAWAPLFGHDLAAQPSVALKQVGAMGRHDVSARLGELAHIPALIMSGDEDKLAPASQGRALSGALPHARYIELAGHGHAAPIYAPELFNEPLDALWSGR